MRNCFTVRTAVTSGSGPCSHPTFHPVNENVLPAEEMVIVRCRIPGSVAIGTCRASSNVRCSYTSSVTTTTSCRRATAAIASSSSRSRTVPVGLCGEFTTIRRVRSVTAARSASTSSRKRSGPGSRGTVTCRAPASAMHAAWES
ncbi:Uncharacterised protein [Mycobacteroides abscessus]|nr:Uncharacterised protein [Mycobacteroides abscessus]